MSLFSVKQSLISNSQSLIPESDIFFRKNLGARGALGALGAAGALVFFRLIASRALVWLTFFDVLYVL